MSGVMNFLKNSQYSPLIVMGAILAGGHYGWRQLQEQEEFVPKGTQKEYPWFEIARHVKESKEQSNTEASAESNQSQG